MRLAVMVFSLFAFCSAITKAELGKIVSNSDFVYQETSQAQAITFVKQFTNNRMTADQVRLINETAKKENVSFIWVMSRIQGEQGLVVNFDDWHHAVRIERLFSYGLSIVDKRTGISPYLGFTNQVTNAIHRMREFADEWKPGRHADVDGFGSVECKNAAVYSLHRYNCRWGAASNYGVYNLGNELFIRILRDFQKLWLSIAESN